MKERKPPDDNLSIYRNLIAEARTTGRWFWRDEGKGQQWWLTPSEVEDVVNRGAQPHQAGPGCWLLKDPFEWLRLLKAESDKAHRQYTDFLTRVHRNIDAGLPPTEGATI